MHYAAPDALERAQRIKLMIFDVDGVLTDGKLWYGPMGEDVVDLPVLTRCGFGATVPDSPEEVRRRVHYVAGSPAGHGAAREVCEFIMRAQGTLGKVLAEYLK